MDKSISENRWLPPSPHREEVLKAIESGRACIEERGHNTPPLLVFVGEGGAIELPKVRYAATRRGMQLVAVGDSSPAGQTRHPDVCGTVDELKGLLRETPELVESDPDALRQLLDDALYMVSRLQQRRETYAKFATEVATLCEKMDAATGPDPEDAYDRLGRIRAALRESPEAVSARLDALDELAEGVRDVANALERRLRECRETAIEVGALYARVKGGRDWQPQPHAPN